MLPRTRLLPQSTYRNNPETNFDTLGQGLFALLDLGEFWARFPCTAQASIKAEKALESNDKLKYCYAFCFISKNCGKPTVTGTGMLKEIGDIKRDTTYEYN